MSEVITTAYSEIGDVKNFSRKEYIMQLKAAHMVLAWLSCNDLAVILTSVPCIMICHDLTRVTMI